MKEENKKNEYEILSSSFMTFDYNFKIIVIGNSEVGKSALAYRATKNQFNGNTSPTICFEYCEFNINILNSLNKNENIFTEKIDYQLEESAQNKKIKLSIWDTCGQEAYRSLVNNFFHSSSMAIIVYAINDRDSFTSINDWVKQVQTQASPNCKIALIGNKADLNEDEREISYEDGKKLAEENQMSFFMETSAKNGQNSRELFVNAAYLLYYNYIQTHADNQQNFFSSFFSKPNCEISINEIPKRRPCYLREQDGERIKIPAFYDKEDVSGEVLISLTSRSFDHNGIKIELLGIIESTTETTNTSQFITLSKELEPAGTLHNQHSKFKFTFTNVEKSYETYHGVEIELKYMLRVIIATTLRNLTWEREIGVINPNPRDILNILNDPIQLEVGIDEWLHLTFELDKTKYGTKDLCTGRVVFKKVSLRLKSMSLEVVRKEALIGSYVDQSLLCKYEVMDGAPVKNETVPIRFFLSPYELTPTYPNVNNKFSVQYYINLVLIDGDDKRYYKQTEIILYRIPRVPIDTKPK